MTRKAVTSRIAVAGVSVFLTLLALEVGVRISRDKLLSFESVFAPSVERMIYDSELGWIPRSGTFELAWVSNVDEANIRSNGRPIPASGRPLLTVGDSFTYGDDVEDNETWESQLEELLKTRVINAGVGGYGVDQAFLRAQRLVDRYQPDVLILAFISDDINRTEYSNNSQGWKPYFEYRDGDLTLKNVPVPQEPMLRPLRRLRQALSYSLLADVVFTRIAAQWWRGRIFDRIHTDGENISVELLARLHRVMADRGGRFIAVAFGTNGRIGNNIRLPNVVRGAREQGVQVLDLATETGRLPAAETAPLFGSGGHFSPAGNRWVAEHIAAYLQQTAAP